MCSLGSNEWPIGFIAVSSSPPSPSSNWGIPGAFSFTVSAMQWKPRLTGKKLGVNFPTSSTIHALIDNIFLYQLELSQDYFIPLFFNFNPVV